jgi:hypothetical protein
MENDNLQSYMCMVDKHKILVIQADRLGLSVGVKMSQEQKWNLTTS